MLKGPAIHGRSGTEQSFRDRNPTEASLMTGNTVPSWFSCPGLALGFLGLRQLLGPQTLAACLTELTVYQQPQQLS